ASRSSRASSSTEGRSRSFIREKSKYTRAGWMGAGTGSKGNALCACLVAVLFVSTSGAAARVGIGRMTVVPTRVIAGTTANELSFEFTDASGALMGQTLRDVQTIAA